MNYNDFCQNLVNEVPDSVAAGIVDLTTGLLLGAYHNVPYFTQAYLDAVAAASVDMFRGKNVTRVEQLLGKQRGQNAVPSIEEIQMTTKGTYHFMKTVGDILLVLITKRTANMGMGWSSVRMAVGDLKK